MKQGLEYKNRNVETFLLEEPARTSKGILLMYVTSEDCRGKKDYFCSKFSLAFTCSILVENIFFR